MRRKTPRPLTVSCSFCGWFRTGRAGTVLAAQREHRLLHVSTAAEGRTR